MRAVTFTMLALGGDLAKTAAAWREDAAAMAAVVVFLCLGLAVTLTCLALLVHHFRRARLRWETPTVPALKRGRGMRQKPMRFPARWLAVRSSEPLQVQEAFGLTNPSPCSWADALSATAEQQLFISPPLSGWVLILGSSLPDPAEDIDKCYVLVAELSRKLGHVQFFSLNRACNHHAWAQARQGKVLRAYAWAGTTLWHQGCPTRAELELRMCCFEYGEVLPPRHLGEANPLAANTEKVPLLAARWSVDPAAIPLRTVSESRGIAGEISPGKIV